MKQLRFGNTGVAHQQDVNVAPIAGAVLVDLSFATKQLQHQGFLDVIHAEDGRCNAPSQKVVDPAVPCNLLDLVLLFFGNDDFLERNVLSLEGVNAQKDVKHRRVFASFALRTNEEHPVCFHAVPRVQATCEILFADAEDALRLDAAFHLLGQFLQFNELRVDEVRGVLLQYETGLALVSSAPSVNLNAFKRFNQFLFVGLIDVHGVSACQTFEHG